MQQNSLHFLHELYMFYMTQTGNYSDVTMSKNKPVYDKLILSFGFNFFNFLHSIHCKQVQHHSVINRKYSHISSRKASTFTASLQHYSSYTILSMPSARAYTK